MVVDQKQVPKESQKTEDTQTPEPKDLKAKGEEIKGDLDDIMDEIEDVLEENAEQLVKDYVQKGGQ